MDPQKSFNDLIDILQRMMDDSILARDRDEAVRRFTGLLDSLEEEAGDESKVKEDLTRLAQFLFHWFWKRRKRVLFRLKQRAREAYVEDLVWGVKRFLRLVEPPLGGVPRPTKYRRWHDPTLREERLLSGALWFQRKVMANHSEEGMRPEKRYYRTEVPFAGGRRDGEPVKFLSKEDALRLEKETMRRASQGADYQWTFRKDAGGQVAEAVADGGGEPQADE